MKLPRFSEGLTKIEATDLFSDLDYAISEMKRLAEDRGVVIRKGDSIVPDGGGYQTPFPFGESHARRTDPDTNHRAAVEAADFAESHKGIILEALKKMGKLTQYGIAEVTPLDRYQAHKRVSDLVRDGLVRDSGFREKGGSGRYCILWEAI